MKVTSNETATTVTRSFTITEDNPVHPFAYSLTGKKVRVDSGVIEYQWTPGGWVVQSECDVSLYCTVLKKDGTESLLTHSRRPDIHWERPRSANLELTDEFAWLQSVIDLLRPSGDLTMMTLNEAEVTG